MASSGQSWPEFTLKNYAQFFASGALCATLTHAAMTPIDVVKTTIQVNPAYKGQSLITATRQLTKAEGVRVLLTGFGPTAAGYFVQGGGKFAGYEFFKLELVKASGGYDDARAHRSLIYVGAASAAEFIADIFLTPLEAVRIRLVSQKGYATGLASGCLRMAREGGLREFYSGFIPILFKQVPYAVGQFALNEFAHERLAQHRDAIQASPLLMSVSTLGCGIFAGAGAAIISHPGDTLLSMINKGHGGTGGVVSRLWNLALEAGPKGLFAGLGPRIVMTAGLVSGQFGIYGACKAALKAPPGVEIHNKE